MADVSGMMSRVPPPAPRLQGGPRTHRARRAPRRHVVLTWVVALALTSVLVPARIAGQATPADPRLAEFLEADTAKDAARLAEKLATAGIDVTQLLERLSAGRAYAADVPRGELTWRTVGPGGIPLVTTVQVPRDYSPTTRYPVRVFLHGGVMRQTAEESEGGPTRRPRRRLECAQPCIAVYPTGSSDAPWWGSTQIDALARTLDRLKRTYNVDENRVHLMGVSDGATGAYYFGLRDATAWSVLYPFNGHMGVLANPGTGVDGDLYASNLTNVPLYVVNGGVDPLYPVAFVEPYLTLLQRAGAPMTFRPRMQAGHDTSWWPEEQPLVDGFERRHPRDPFPDRVSWRTDRVDRDNRFRWLVIDALDASRRETAIADPNTIERQIPYDFGLRVDSRKEQGRRLVTVMPYTDAEKMGLRRDDLLLTIDGRAIVSADDIGRAFEAHTVRGPLVIVVERKGARLETQVEFPPEPQPPVRQEAFARRRPSGRVDLQRKGNTVEARTQGVGAFTLLLSPSEFEFEKPIVVTVNGETVHDAVVKKDAAALLRWAARDNDRTMLVAAELKIVVPAR